MLWTELELGLMSVLVCSFFGEIQQFLYEEYLFASFMDTALKMIWGLPSGCTWRRIHINKNKWPQLFPQCYRLHLRLGTTSTRYFWWHLVQLCFSYAEFLLSDLWTHPKNLSNPRQRQGWRPSWVLLGCLWSDGWWVAPSLRLALTQLSLDLISCNWLQNWNKIIISLYHQ